MEPNPSEQRPPWESSHLEVIRPEASGVAEFGGLSREKIELLKRTICRGATDDELELAQALVQRTKLDPFARQIAFIKRYDGQLKREVMTPQITIDGARLLAERTRNYGGQLGPWWCGSDGIWQDVWLSSTPPVAAKVGIIRTDWKEPLFAVARFDAYAAKNKDGNLIALWAKMPDLMIAKCAEMLALRRALPAEFSGIYSEDEMAQAVVRPARDIDDQTGPGRPAEMVDWTTFWTHARARGIDAPKFAQLVGRAPNTFSSPQDAWDALITASESATPEPTTTPAPIDAEYRHVDQQTGEALPIDEDEAFLIEWGERSDAAFTLAEMGNEVDLQRLYAEAGDHPAQWLVLLRRAPTLPLLRRVRTEHVKSGCASDPTCVAAYNEHQGAFGRPGGK